MSVTQNVVNVWISMGETIPGPSHAISGQSLHGAKTCKQIGWVAILLGGAVQYHIFVLSRDTPCTWFMLGKEPSQQPF